MYLEAAASIRLVAMEVEILDGRQPSILFDVRAGDLEFRIARRNEVLPLDRIFILLVPR